MGIDLSINKEDIKTMKNIKLITSLFFFIITFCLPIKPLFSMPEFEPDGSSYRIINKWHLDKGLPAFLDADSDNPNGRVYRSGFDSENTQWHFQPDASSPGFYKIVNRWHLRKGVAAFLDADSNNQNGHVYRSGFDSDNTKWCFQKDVNSPGFYKIVNKWHLDKGLPAFLDADSNNQNGRIYRSGFDSDNTKWMFSKLY